MDFFDEDVLNFFRALDKNEVKYILIGGYAVNFHGYHRFTGDVDIWLFDDIKNRQALRNAFIDCGMPDYPMVETMQFAPGWTQFHLNNGLILDILTNMKGLESLTFDECLKEVSFANIEDVKIPFLHISQLIANKRLVDRPKDRDDVNALEQIEKLRDYDYRQQQHADKDQHKSKPSDKSNDDHRDSSMTR